MTILQKEIEMKSADIVAKAALIKTLESHLLEKSQQNPVLALHLNLVAFNNCDIKKRLRTRRHRYFNRRILFLS